MSNTLALWSEQIAGPDHPGQPTVRVHVNFWRHIRRDGTDITLLDIGLLLENTKGIGKFYLYLPISADIAQISDLGRLLAEERTLTAVFNESLHVRRAADDKSFTALNDDDVVQFQCQYVSLEEDVEFRTDHFGADKKGTLITFDGPFCARLRQDDPQYIRLRFALDAEAVSEFITNTTPEDSLLLSTFARTEIIEFRFNERRNYPPHVIGYTRADNATEFNVSEVNYFLIRDVRFDYILSHADFRKMRKLEGDRWRAYLGPLFQDVDPNRMLIYQWKKPDRGPSDKPIDDFIALAKFRFPSPNVGWYIFAIILLGFGGSSIATFLTSALQSLGLSEICANILVVLLFALTVAAMIWKLFRAK
jgi:hypothetical protein